MRIKQVCIFLACLLCASLFWLGYNLSLQYSSYFRIRIIADCNMVGRESRAKADRAILVKGKATGFYILQQKHKKEETVVNVTLEPTMLTRIKGTSDGFWLIASNIQESVGNALSSKVSIESLFSDTLKFKYPNQSFKKVPVTFTATLDFAPQYMVFKPYKVVPDSVFVYGNDNTLKDIKCVYTESVHYSSLEKSVQGVVKFREIPDVRISDKEVSYEIYVERYVELSKRVRLSVEGAQENSTLALMPNQVTLKFRSPLSKSQELKDAKFKVAVSFEDYLQSVNGRVIPYIVSSPDEAAFISIQPNTIDCILQKR